MSRMSMLEHDLQMLRGYVQELETQLKAEHKARILFEFRAKPPEILRLSEGRWSAIPQFIFETTPLPHRKICQGLFDVAGILYKYNVKFDAYERYIEEKPCE